MKIYRLKAIQVSSDRRDGGYEYETELGYGFHKDYLDSIAKHLTKISLEITKSKNEMYDKHRNIYYEAVKDIEKRSSQHPLWIKSMEDSKQETCDINKDKIDEITKYWKGFSPFGGYTFKVSTVDLGEEFKPNLDPNKTYELNSEVSWNFTDPLPSHIPVWVLLEEETSDPDLYPTVAKVIHDNEGEPGRKTRLLDFDPETQEEYLQWNRYSLKAWRPMTFNKGYTDDHES
jgi:hypothetical protein